MKRISNFKFQISNFKGFTLVEMLVAMGLFTTVAVIIVSVLFTAFRANRKSEVILSVKQEGNLALSRIAQAIRYAKSLDIPTSCVVDPVTQEAINQESVTVTAFDGGQTTYACPGDLAATISSNGAALVNVSGVKVDGCSFTCFQTTTNDPPTITIKFNLTPVTESDFVENTALIPFQTAVTLRNYNK